MSTTATTIDARAYLGAWLNALTGMTSADIKAMPTEKWGTSFGGCTRSAQDVVAETANLLNWTAEAMRGNVVATMEDAYPAATKEACATQQGAVATLAAASKNFAEALASASDETLQAEVTPPWQMPAPLFMIAQIAVSHVWYHDGQLNFMQCLLGDEKVHWMGD